MREMFRRRALVAVVVAIAMGTAACSPGAKWNAPGETPDPQEWVPA